MSARKSNAVVKPNSVDEIYEAGYLAANPDVQRAGIPAKAHFLSFGQREGRLQWVNENKVAELREEKLQRLRFRRKPVRPRGHGQAVNFLPDETIAEFGIPDAPPVSASVYGGPFIEEIRNNPDKLCLDVGAGLRFSYFSNVVNTEIYPSFSTYTAGNGFVENTVTSQHKLANKLAKPL